MLKMCFHENKREWMDFAKSVLAEKNVCRCGRTRILTDSVKKRNRKEALANYIKTRINIGHQHDRWMELKEALRV
jgi:hypothetical protein